MTFDKIFDLSYQHCSLNTRNFTAYSHRYLVLKPHYDLLNELLSFKQMMYKSDINVIDLMKHSSVKYLLLRKD